MIRCVLLGYDGLYTFLLSWCLVVSLMDILGRYQSGQMGLTVNQLSCDFVGSNPTLPTTLRE